MQNVTLSLPLEELKKEISEDLFKRLVPIIQHVSHYPRETELITRKEAAKMLGISLNTIQQWTKEGKITAYRISTRIRFKRTELENSLKKIKGGRL